VTNSQSLFEHPCRAHECHPSTWMCPDYASFSRSSCKQIPNIYGTVSCSWHDEMVIGGERTRSNTDEVCRDVCALYLIINDLIGQGRLFTARAVAEREKPKTTTIA